jgi:hypothetical protein
MLLSSLSVQLKNKLQVKSALDSLDDGTEPYINSEGHHPSLSFPSPSISPVGSAECIFYTTPISHNRNHE